MIAKLYKLSGNNQYLADKIETAKSFTTSYVLAHGKDAVAEQHLRVKEYNES
jgi:hypothetical protein